MMKRTKRQLTLGLAAGLLLSVPVSAEKQDQPSNVAEVFYGDLDLARSADRAELDQRLRAAIKQACGTGHFGSAGVLAGRRKCRRSLRRQAKATVEALLAQPALAEARLAITYRRRNIPVM